MISEAIARGGMGTVHVGRLLGSVGFRRLVAIKRVHPDLASDPQVVRRFRREATLSGRILHPSVVATLDVIAEEGELFLVMELVRGESLAQLMKESRAKGETIPVGVASAVMVSVLAGLSAAHLARDEAGHPLRLVHLDVSPQNVLVGVDGLGRIADFGIAQSSLDSQRETDADRLRGKPRYLAPEQLGYHVGALDGRTDCFAACVILWEALAGRSLWTGESTAEIVEQILKTGPPSLRALRDDVPAALDDVLLRGLQRDPGARFDGAAELAAAIEASPAGIASQRTIAAWVTGLAGAQLANIDERIQALERPQGELDAFDLDSPTVDYESSSPGPEEPATPLRAPGRRILIDEAEGTRSLTIDVPSASVRGPEAQLPTTHAASPRRQKPARSALMFGALIVPVLFVSAVGLRWWQGLNKSPSAAGPTTPSPEEVSALPEAVATPSEAPPRAVAPQELVVSASASAPGEVSTMTTTSTPAARVRSQPATRPSAAKQPGREVQTDPLGKPYIADRP